jgi:SAM-dependent methyltransferase
VNPPPLFDRYAESYDQALDRALAATGSDKEFFAQGRVKWLAECLQALKEKPRRAMDFGCGVGSTAPLLRSSLGVEELFGIDVSPASIAVAKQKYESAGIRYSTLGDYVPDGTLDLVYCNGVFHHIEPLGRLAALNSIGKSLRHEGVLAFWENNPWNPGARYVMSRCPFDADARTLSMFEVKKLLRAAGFTILRTDFLFIFPNFLRLLRPLERWISKMPLGAQFQILARKQAESIGITTASPQ